MDNLDALDDEELIAHLRDRIAKVKLHRQEIAAHGLDPDLWLNRDQPLLADLEKMASGIEAANEVVLQTTADLADHRYKLFKASQDLLRQMEEIAPFDSLTEQMREEVEEMAKHMPKEQ